LDTRFLESLIAVVESGSIAAAARLQNLTPAAVGQRVRALENEVGQSLLSRSGHKAHPTEACLKLLARARVLVQESRLLKSDLDPTGMSGPLCLGSISTGLTDFVPGVVRQIAQTAPDADLSVIPGTSSHLYDLLLDDAIDGAITVAPPFGLPKSVQCHVIARQRLILVSADHAGQPPADLIGEKPLIVYDKHSWGGLVAWNWISRQKAPIRVLCELDSLETIAILVEQGLGIAVVPEWSGLRQRHSGLVVSELPASETSVREIVFLMRRSSPMQTLLRVVKDTLVCDVV